MNRKSFYYHFCDKYDLVNWIFDTEFSEIRNRPDHIANFEDICELFLFRPRVFIAARSRLTGQNSFRDYFRMQIHPVLEELVGNLFDSEEDTEFLVTFLADGMVSTLIRWLNSSDPEPPEEMARRVRRTMVAISQAIVTTYEEEERKAAKE